MNKKLHIVCFDIPYPVDYGGIIDVFYKLKALCEAGVQIHLHCFEYGRARHDELKKYCKDVFYYQRRKGLSGFSSSLPYIVNSRKNNDLLQNLLTNDDPILLEGIHCSYLLTDERFKHRRIFLRLMNVEYMYYHQLSKTTSSIRKKLYYAYESRLLYRYEKGIARKVMIAALSEQDVRVYQKEFRADKISYFPAFLPYSAISCREGVGSYCLYHGNLSVAENEKAAIWLLENVFNDVDTAFVIAGKNPSGHLKKKVAERPNTCLIATPTEEEMQDLITKSQIHILPSFNSTGVKLKLLNALFNGRHCVVNEAAVSGTALATACHVGRTPSDIKNLIARLYRQPFTKEDIQHRKLLLERTYANATNANSLIQWIW